jgi:ribosome biogenesis GTPase A
MWPKIDHEQDGYLLAANNAIGKNAYHEAEVAEKLGTILLKHYSLLLQSRYRLENINIDGIELLEQIAKNNKFPMKNHSVDIEKAATNLLNDYRQGRIGKISLESPNTRIEKIRSYE